MVIEPLPDPIKGAGECHHLLPLIEPIGKALAQNPRHYFPPTQ
jgi:hypothetical protein